MKNVITVLATLLFLSLFGCNQGQEVITTDASATDATVKANRNFATELPLSDQQDFEDAMRGLVVQAPSLVIKNDLGGIIWSQDAFKFVEGEAPETVNPSLWRQAKLNSIHGLFKVTDGIYQVRGYDLSNMTLIEGDSGWIIVDPLTTKETANAAFQLATSHLGIKPIMAIIFTHSHIDHFGGVLGLVSAEQIHSQGIEIIAPSGFMEEATSENVIAGVPMGRRSGYMLGRQIGNSPLGHVDTGLGKAIPNGTMTIFPPTKIVDHTPQEMTVDGVQFIFQNTPGSEAPAELTFYLPKLKAYCGAEVVSKTMHNVLTLRGAKVRDALLWSSYIDEAIHLFPDAQVYFASHHWPHWGSETITAFLKQQRDTYKYIHDQTMRLAGAGMTPREIAAEIQLPGSLATIFSNRGYYGTISHNSRAVYQHYFGWYDGNPANLDPLPPVEAGRLYVKAMGGSEQVLKIAQSAFDAADYRWVAELLNHLVFAEPDNQRAKKLLASTYDQLGFQAEAGTWRDIYLTGASELRNGVPSTTINLANALELLQQTPVPRFFDAMATRINGPKADGLNMIVNIVFTDLDESYVLNLENAVLHHRQAPNSPDANATLTLTHTLFEDADRGSENYRSFTLG